MYLRQNSLICKLMSALITWAYDSSNLGCLFGPFLLVTHLGSSYPFTVPDYYTCPEKSEGKTPFLQNVKFSLNRKSYGSRINYSSGAQIFKCFLMIYLHDIEKFRVLCPKKANLEGKSHNFRYLSEKSNL